MIIMPCQLSYWTYTTTDDNRWFKILTKHYSVSAIEDLRIISKSIAEINPCCCWAGLGLFLLGWFLVVGFFFWLVGYFLILVCCLWVFSFLFFCGFGLSLFLPVKQTNCSLTEPALNSSFVFCPKNSTA